MRIHHFHSWDVTPAQAIQIQAQLQTKVIPFGCIPCPKLVAGADAAFDLEARRVFAAVIIFTFPNLSPIETAVHEERLSYPYIPGLLSFREAPALLAAFSKIRHDPDLIFIDGHGLSHPRSAGIACHVGVCLDKAVIGCAKSVLVGRFREPGLARGAESPLCDTEGRVIGAVVRTRHHVKPVFISIGHRIDLSDAVNWSLACGKGVRIPEPTRQADLLAESIKREACRP